jgi:hypothetical protein
MTWAILAAACCATLASCASAQTLFPNSVSSNELDFIRPDDPRAGHCLVPEGRGEREMPGQPGGALFASGVSVFRAAYGDGTAIELWAHPDLSDPPSLADAVARRVGHLPRVMRDRLGHVVLHPGDGAAFAEHLGRFFVLYEDNVATRARDGDLEETVFHESVHATLDAEVLEDPAWLAAQRADGGFVTDYAASRPDKEDLAESALFAHALLRTPGRLPAEVEARVREVMPARLAYVAARLDALEPLEASVPAPPC